MAPNYVPIDKKFFMQTLKEKRVVSENLEVMTKL